MLELRSNVDIAKKFGTRYATRGQVQLAGSRNGLAGSGEGLAGRQGQRTA